MIEFPRDPQNVIPTSSVKIVGLGGAGANMLDRVALDGLDGAELLALNTDIRTLSASVASEKIQLGRNLTKGLGTGGDPELGRQAVTEAEDEIRASLKGRKIVFICVGLGGGTGSGAAPIVARIAREEGAFVVMFATTPFVFEGDRRREQAETSLNELAVLSNALVTFDNGRMGELVLAKQGIHEAFAAADRMISESIKAVIRLVVRPGLINVGLDDLMTALRTTRSRCLFGSGIADGKDRAQKALRNALASPLLDQGSLLKDAESVLVHLCGGEDLTLFEIELLMESLSKHVPEKAHVLFGAAIDPAMGEQLSITLVSSLPEERLRVNMKTDLEDHAPVKQSAPAPEPVSEPEESEEIEERVAIPPSHLTQPISEKAPSIEVEEPEITPEETPEEETIEEPEEPKEEKVALKPNPLLDPQPKSYEDEDAPESGDDDGDISDGDDFYEETDPSKHYQDEPFAETSGSAPSKKAKLPEARKVELPELKEVSEEDEAEKLETDTALFRVASEDEDSDEKKDKGSQTELSFDGGPKGRFEDTDPSIFEGEDLDVPAFLRKKRK